MEPRRDSTRSRRRSPARPMARFRSCRWGATCCTHRAPPATPRPYAAASSPTPIGWTSPPSPQALRDAFGFSADMLYLSPGPLYHAAPLAYVTRALEAGGGAVIMRRFDAAAALGA